MTTAEQVADAFWGLRHWEQARFFEALTKKGNGAYRLLRWHEMYEEMSTRPDAARGLQELYRPFLLKKAPDALKVLSNAGIAFTRVEGGVVVHDLYVGYETIYKVAEALQLTEAYAEMEGK